MRERFQVKWRPGWVAVPAALITAKLSRNARLCWTILAHQAQANSSSDMKSLGELLADGDKPAPDRKTIRGWVDELEQARWLTRYRTVNGNEYELHEPSAAPPLPDDSEPQAPAGDQPTAPDADEAEPEPPVEDDITWQTFHDELLKLDVKAAHKLQGVAIPNRTAALKHVQAMAAAGAGGGAIFNWVRDEGHNPIAVDDSESFIERHKKHFTQPPLDEQPDTPEPTPAPQPQRTRGQRTTKHALHEIIRTECPDFIDHVYIDRYPTQASPLCQIVFSSDRAKEDFRPHAPRIKAWIAEVTGVATFETQALVHA